MAGTTSAFVLVGEHSVGPFQSRNWRARHGIALIEKHRRVWMPTPVAHGVHEDVSYGPILFPYGLSPAEELMIVVAACAVRPGEVLDALADEGLAKPLALGPGNLTLWLDIDDERIDGLPPSPQIIELAVEAVRDRARLGVVRLEPQSELGDDSVLWMRSQGLDVDDFRLMAAPGAEL